MTFKMAAFMKKISSSSYARGKSFGQLSGFKKNSCDEIRQFCQAVARCTSKPMKYFGQTTIYTHPHLFNMHEVTPGITKDEYRSRRKTLMKSLSNAASRIVHKNHIMILKSAPKYYMSTDVPYLYRQNTDFLYFSGFLEPESVLILHNDKSKGFENFKEVLFVKESDPNTELWEGSSTGRDRVSDLVGIESAEDISNLENYLQKYLYNFDDFVVWFDKRNKVNSGFRHDEVVEQFIFERPMMLVENPTRLTNYIRLIKSQSEIDLMMTSNSIASEAFIEVMKFSKPKVDEALLFAKMDFECRLRGAEYLAYPPVVAGGNRANTIHYISNNQLIEDGELVLMDAGCEYHGYCSDITRTWPVSGKFSSVQKKLYNAVLNVQKKCIELCRPGITLDKIFKKMLDCLADELIDLGFLSASANDEERFSAARRFCPHHVGHYLGMDVHDCSLASRNIPLQPRMVITIEPGLYIPYSNADVPEEYRGIGIRIEDDILITENGYFNLTHACPKTIEDIEDIMSSL